MTPLDGWRGRRIAGTAPADGAGVTPASVAPVTRVRGAGRAPGRLLGLVLGVVAALVGGLGPGAVPAGAQDGPTVQRLGGADRYGTAAAVAATFDPRVARVFLATGTTFADALGAASVAGSHGIPVLLVRPDAIPAATAGALDRLEPAAITVLGGPDAVDEAVVSAAAAYTDGPVDRLAGPDRYATAAAVVLDHTDPGVPMAYVATGTGFADSLAGSAAAAATGGPLLLVRPDRVPAETAQALDQLRPERIVVLGGEAAVGPEVEAALAAHTSGSVERVAGADRYATAAATVGAAFPDPAGTVVMATGEDFPDALAGAALAGARGAPVVTVPGTCVTRSVLDQVDRLAPTDLVVLGGDQAVDPAAAALEACGSGPRWRSTTIHGGLDVPWDLGFTPDGRTFLTERDTGRVLERAPDGATRTVLALDVDADLEGGLLGLAVSPTWGDDGFLYAMLVTDADQRVVRFRADGSALEPVVVGLPRGDADNRSHFGGRIDFGPDGMLYVAVGDVREDASAQDPTRLSGKILRYTPTGEVPADNPFHEGPGDPTPGDDPVWALGFRNPQGLAWDPDGRMYASEFGPNRDDEINRIVPGGNYGWPVVTGARGADRGFVEPVVVRQPPEASWSGISVVSGGAIPAWDGDLLVASLRGQRLYRIDLEDGQVVDVEALLVGVYGRLRHVVGAPDGSLWVLTSNRDDNGDPVALDDRIVRLAP